MTRISTVALATRLALVLALSTSLSVADEPKIATLTPVAAEAQKTPDKLDATKVVGEFPDGTKVTLGQVLDSYKTLPPQLKDVALDKVYEALLNRLVDMKLVLDASIKAGLDKDSDVTKRIAEAQEALVQKGYLDKEIAKLITDSTLQEKYQELLKMMPQGQIEVKLSHILVKTKQEAEVVLKDLKSGKKFEEMAKSKSIDPQTKDIGGELGFVRKGDLPKEAADSVFKTAKGALVSEPISMGEMGYSVLRVDEKRPVDPPKFEEVKADIQKAVAPEFAVKVIEKIRKDANVKKFGLDGKPLVEKTDAEKKAQEDEAKKDGPKKDEKPSVDVEKLDSAMVVAEFTNGEKVTLGQIKDSVKTLPPQLRAAPFDKIYEPLLNRMIDMKLISEVARKDGLDKDSAVLKKMDEAKNALIQKGYLDKEVAKLITAEMVKDKYTELLKLLPKDEMEIRLRHILVKTKKEADEIMKELKSGGKFDEIAKTKSADDQTKVSGGDLGYVKKADLPKEFGEAVFKAAKATLLPEPVNLGEMGFSVVRVEDKRPVEPPQLEEVKGEIVRLLSIEQAGKVIEGLRKDVTVKKFDMEGKPLVEKTEEQKKADAELLKKSLEAKTKG
ncbi:MAG: peptidylprolyl isomerase [Alphaproteobacteria bacterium]|nr:peptidylprolyl isomerase [Alphaproteobacteria bacterium]